MAAGREGAGPPPGASAGAGPAKLLVVANPAAPETAVLQRLPAGVELVAVSPAPAADVAPEALAEVTVVLNCGVGPNAGKKSDLQAAWPLMPGLRWLHSASAGLEHLLGGWPELVASDVVLTNAAGVYAHSLAEFALFGCKYFALDVPRLARQKAARTWQKFDVEELRGRTLGIVGYGGIGRAVGRLAAAHGMRVVAARRNPAKSWEADEVVAEVFGSGPDELVQLAAICDYLVVATPATPATTDPPILSAAVLAAMKPSAVLVGVGRGKCVDEAALVAALEAGRLKGAALDVFAEEPLPAASPLWDFPNVLITPHCADQTSTFQFDSLEFFLANCERYVAGGVAALQNVADKRNGY